MNDPWTDFSWEALKLMSDEERGRQIARLMEALEAEDTENTEDPEAIE